VRLLFERYKRPTERRVTQSREEDKTAGEMSEGGVVVVTCAGGVTAGEGERPDLGGQRGASGSLGRRPVRMLRGGQSGERGVALGGGGIRICFETGKRRKSPVATGSGPRLQGGVRPTRRSAGDCRPEWRSAWWRLPSPP